MNYPTFQSEYNIGAAKVCAGDWLRRKAKTDTRFIEGKYYRVGLGDNAYLIQDESHTYRQPSYISKTCENYDATKYWSCWRFPEGFNPNTDDPDLLDNSRHDEPKTTLAEELVGQTCTARMILCNGQQPEDSQMPTQEPKPVIKKEYTVDGCSASGLPDEVLEQYLAAANKKIQYYTELRDSAPAGQENYIKVKLHTYT
jgi:hypothetical protein